MSQPKCDLILIAQRYIREHFQNFDPNGLRLVISEQSHLWQLTYELPADTLGGVPIVTIDKRTCKVVRAEHTQ